jgi:serine/threonine protein kinase
MHWYGREAPYNILILNHLNLTLEESISKCHDISLVFSYAHQMVFIFSAFYNPGHLAHITLLQLSCLESMHSQNYIHQDVKPTNFMTSISKLSNQIFLIDFGLAQLFCNPSTHRHVLLISRLKTVGTIAFTSTDSHLGLKKSHCDDLELLVYSIVYLFCGRLPWQDIKEGVEQYEEAILKKKTTLDKVLCQGLPLPFVTFALHIQSLGFNEKPQYNYLCALLMQCLVHDPNDVVSEHTTLLHSPCKLSIPTTLPRDQQM